MHLFNHRRHKLNEDKLKELSDRLLEAEKAVGFSRFEEALQLFLKKQAALVFILTEYNAYKIAEDDERPETAEYLQGLLEELKVHCADILLPPKKPVRKKKGE